MSQPTTDTAPSAQDTVMEPGAASLPTPDTSAATPPIVPPSPPESTAAGPRQPAQQEGSEQGFQVTPVEYEGWRQYSVNCARCHGQDVLPNPVAANLLVSVGPSGATADRKSFFQVVSEGRPERGMPAFKGALTPKQIDAVYAYVKGRAEKRIPPGRPARPKT
jgi:mono/diheme cytochrome c family protein